MKYYKQHDSGRTGQDRTKQKILDNGIVYIIIKRNENKMHERKSK